MDETRPGKTLLIVGAVAYVLAALVSMLWLAVSPEAGLFPLEVLLFAPPMLALAAVAISPSVLIVGLVSGTPAVSITYVLENGKRYWRAVLGCLLIVSALAAVSMLLL